MTATTLEPMHEAAAERVAGGVFDGPTYVLRVKGKHFEDAQVRDGDYLVLSRREARSGDTVLAAVAAPHETMVIRRVVYEPRYNDPRPRGEIVLESSTPGQAPLVCTPAEKLRIRGVIVGVIRRYA